MRETSNEVPEVLGREARFQQALNEVIERHPDLEAAIRRSLLTPQLGEYHNEGPRMDSHVGLIIETIDNIRSRKFPEDLANYPDVQEIMRQLVSPEEGVSPEITDYAFLHDIAKPDCLTLKLEEQKDGTEVTWEQWQAIEAAGEPYQYEGKAVNSISYFHSSEGSAGQHGNKGAEQLKKSGVSEDILAAMQKHEVAYQFGKINASTYEEHFVKAGFTADQHKFILLASYIDTMASLRLDGKPDLKNFQNLLHSRENFLLIKKFLDQGVKISENKLNSLKNSDKVLSDADLESVIEKIRKYDMEVLEKGLQELANSNLVEQGDVKLVLELVIADQPSLGRKMGRKMAVVKPLLARCEIK